MNMMNKVTVLMVGIVLGAILCYTYEDEMHDLQYDMSRYARKAKKKMRDLQSYMD